MRSTSIPPRPGERPAPGPPGAAGAETRSAGLVGGLGAARKPANFRGSARRLLGMMRPERPLILATLALSAASVGLLILGPWLLGRATDIIFAGLVSVNMKPGTTKAQAIARLRHEGKGNIADMFGSMNIVPGHGIDFGHLGRLLLVVLAAYVAGGFLQTLQGRLSATIVQRLMRRLRGMAQAKLSQLPLSYFDGQPRGELLSRVTNDIDNLSQTMQQTLSQILVSALTIVGVLVIMLLISPLLAVIALVTVPLSLVTASRILKRARPNFARQWMATGRLNAYVEEMYTGHSLVKLFGQEENAERTFAENNNTLFDSSAKAQFASNTIQPSMMFINNLNFVVIAVVGALRVATGAISLGDVQAFIQYSRQFSQPIVQMASVANLLQSAVVSAERIFALLDAEEQSPDPASGNLLSDVSGQVDFENVSFRYVRDQPLIENLSLSVRPGQSIAIVGPTGAGKTTLVNLLMRFYEVDSGRIMIDGVDIATMTRENLRSKTGMVLQDAWLFGGSVAENIAYGAPDATREQIVEAARATAVDHFVRTLPDGYDTVLDEDGTNVSVGEKQLITVARAFIARPAILILDEATSSVDTRTELLIQRAMNVLREGRTSFIIAHRLSTIRDADTILMMEDGQIIEQGTHDELILADGAYARLYAAQFEQATARQ